MRSASKTSKASVFVIALILALVAGVVIVQQVGASGPPVASSLLPITPCRLADTRGGVGPRVGALQPDETVGFAVVGTNGQCTIPGTATAISANVTIVNPTSASFLTLFPSDVSRPSASNLNWTATSSATPNAVTVRLGASGAIAAYNLAGAVDVIIDIVGYYDPATSGPTGPSGPSGPAGTPGTPGTPGVAGANGANGPSGAQYGRMTNLPSQVATTGNVGLNTSITTMADGNSIISYYDQTNGDLVVIKCTSITCNTRTTTNLDTTGNVGQYTSISIGNDGFPAVSYYDATNLDLKLVRCTSYDCSTAANVVVDSVGNVGQFTSLTFSTVTGFPIIAYEDVTNGNLKVAQCLDNTCATKNVNTIGATAGTVGLYTSITIGGDGLPKIAYYDQTNGDLRYVQCTDDPCTSGSSTPIETTGDVGQATSITTAPDGLSVFSFYDVTNGDLKMFKCATATCTSGSSQVVESTGDVGASSSIAISPGTGFPVIAYRDETNTQLRLATCTTATCSTHTRVTLDASAANVGTNVSMVMASDASPVISYYDLSGGDLRVDKVFRLGWTANNYGH